MERKSGEDRERDIKILAGKISLPPIKRQTAGFGREILNEVCIKSTE